MIFSVNDGSFGFRVNPGTALDFASLEVCLDGQFFGDKELALVGNLLDGLGRLETVHDDRLDPLRYSPRNVVRSIARDETLNDLTNPWTHEWQDRIYFRAFVHAGHFNALAGDDGRRGRVKLRTLRRVVVPVAEYREVAAAVGDYWRSFREHQRNWRV